MGWTEDKNLLDPLNIGEVAGLYRGKPTASRDPVCKWVMVSIADCISQPTRRLEIEAEGEGQMVRKFRHGVW